MLGFCAAEDESPQRRINERRLAPRHYLWHRERRVRGRARAFILGPRNPLCESERSLSLSLSLTDTHRSATLCSIFRHELPPSLPRACVISSYTKTDISRLITNISEAWKRRSLFIECPLGLCEPADRTEPCIEALRRSERVEQPSSISIVPFRCVGEKSINYYSSNTEIVCNYCARRCYNKQEVQVLTTNVRLSILLIQSDQCLV